MSFIARGKPLGNYYEHIISYQERLHETIGKSRKQMAIGIHDIGNIHPPFLLTMKGMETLEFTTYDNLLLGALTLRRPHYQVLPVPFYLMI